MSEIFDKTLAALGASATMRLKRHNVVSSNVANAETPGYKAKKLDFEGALKRASGLETMNGMAATDNAHFGSGKSAIGRVRPDVYDNPDINMSNDGNTVDLEREMAKMAENSILYKAALQLINKKLASMRYAVTEGSR